MMTVTEKPRKVNSANLRPDSSNVTISIHYSKDCPLISLINTGVVIWVACKALPLEEVLVGVVALSRLFDAGLSPSSLL